MFIATIALVGLTAFVAMVVVGQHTGVFATTAAFPAARPTSPLDEAERILAHRYATGQINAEEYDRMLSILRR